jgi:hypothetical protein
MERGEVELTFERVSAYCEAIGAPVIEVLAEAHAIDREERAAG